LDAERDHLAVWAAAHAGARVNGLELARMPALLSTRALPLLRPPALLRQSMLRRTEDSLLHVLDSLDVVCRAATHSSEQELKLDLNELLAAALVRQQEDDIAALLARVGLPSSARSTASSSGSSPVNRAVLEPAANVRCWVHLRLTGLLR
jgi:hypothetical protein